MSLPSVKTFTGTVIKSAENIYESKTRKVYISWLVSVAISDTEQITSKISEDNRELFEFCKKLKFGDHVIVTQTPGPAFNSNAIIYETTDIKMAK